MFLQCYENERGERVYTLKVPGGFWGILGDLCRALRGSAVWLPGVRFGSDAGALGCPEGGIGHEKGGILIQKREN